MNLEYLSLKEIIRYCENGVIEQVPSALFLKWAEHLENEEKDVQEKESEFYKDAGNAKSNLRSALSYIEDALSDLGELD